jgi:hypothetical protein
MNTRNSEKGNLVSPVYSIEILTTKKYVGKKATGPPVCFVFMNCVQLTLYEEILVWWKACLLSKTGST